MKAMPMKTPPAKAFATPRIFGDSRHEEDHVGIDPAMNASRKDTMMKAI